MIPKAGVLAMGHGHIVNIYYLFHDPWGRGSCARVWPSHIVKMHYFFKNLVLYS